jgi:hypothetical protein
MQPKVVGQIGAKCITKILEPLTPLSSITYKCKKFFKNLPVRGIIAQNER